jgi:aryl-alcohol dehydrogenase-like predicted oxidoreductase
MSVHLKPGKMPYRYFGRSGLQTSVISLGNMINTKEETYAVDEQIIKVALENGINHFDTAEGYDNGKAETQLGKILKNLQVPREQIIVATKIRFAPIKDINSDHLISRKHIKESLNGCLQRLQMDYVDILYAHFQDDLTPVEEICRGFHEAIESGKVLYWATSNWDAEMVLNALNACERLNLHKPIGAQNEYNMLQRTEN